MKVKHLGRKIISLFLALAMMIPLALPAFAEGDPSISGGSGGSYVETGDYSSTQLQGSAVRVTLVSAKTGERVSNSVDYSVTAPSVDCYWGMNCKSDYVKNNVQLSAKGGYKTKQPSVNAEEFKALGTFIHHGDGVVNMDAVKKYFTNEDVIKMVCVNTEFCSKSDFDTKFMAKRAEYRLMLEPVGYFKILDDSYAFSATEGAIYSRDHQGDQYYMIWNIDCLLTGSMQVSMFLDYDKGVLSEYIPPASYDDIVNNHRRMSSATNQIYLDFDYCISKNGVGLGFVSFVDDGDLYYHIFSEQREPKNKKDPIYNYENPARCKGNSGRGSILSCCRIIS